MDISCRVNSPSHGIFSQPMGRLPLAESSPLSCSNTNRNWVWTGKKWRRQVETKDVWRMDSWSVSLCLTFAPPWIGSLADTVSVVLTSFSVLGHRLLKKTRRESNPVLSNMVWITILSSWEPSGRFFMSFVYVLWNSWQTSTQRPNNGWAVAES